MNGALLSRMRVFVLEPVSADDILVLIAVHFQMPSAAWGI